LRVQVNCIYTYTETLGIKAGKMRPSLVSKET
jgi:hypothetical protein